MRYYFKLITLSAIFALLPFIMSELLSNIYRINRITGIEMAALDKVNMIIGLVCFTLILIRQMTLIRFRA
ncbi:hypothetical protein SAMN05518847_105314 [Paenibacillus sp. OV219]|nr:hypothetical protein SAMN05518847_105314 [Paenibacillus sp. OV219]